MLYRFKSRASPDFVMLELHARQLLDIVGKAPAPQGIITVEQIPAAIVLLQVVAIVLGSLMGWAWTLGR